MRYVVLTAVEIEELSDWGVDTSIAEENYRAKEQSDVFLCVGLGLAYDF